MCYFTITPLSYIFSGQVNFNRIYGYLQVIVQASTSIFPPRINVEYHTKVSIPEY